MKNLVLKTKFILLAILVAFSYSCSPEDGAPGLPGPAGMDGVDGVNGQNGNANVQNITFDASAFAGTFDSVTISELTQDVLDNDVVLTYLSENGTTWIPVPCPYDTIGFNFSVHVALYAGGMDLDYGDASGSAFSITAGDLTSGRVIIIESTSTTASRTSTSSKQLVYNELAQAGVNITDYYAVCDYYGIAY